MPYSFLANLLSLNTLLLLAKLLLLPLSLSILYQGTAPALVPPGPQDPMMQQAQQTDQQRENNLKMKVINQMNCNQDVIPS